MAKDRTKGERSSADERRAAVLEAAVSEFAVKGWYGASTEDIARKAEISQPYVMRLFGSKKELFLASIELVYERITYLLKEAAEQNPDNKMEAMGNAYSLLLSERHDLLLFLQGFAAAGDIEIRRKVNGCFSNLYRYVAETTSASHRELRSFFANGIFTSVLVAINLPEINAHDD